MIDISSISTISKICKEKRLGLSQDKKTAPPFFGEAVS
jgi:hypothetical protein